MMARIYQEAHHVVVWLGKEDKYSAFAMENFQAIIDSKQFMLLSRIATGKYSNESHRILGLKSGINSLLQKFPLFNILDAA
jgi:hypothetical protein